MSENKIRVDGGPSEETSVAAPNMPLSYEPFTGNFYWSENIGKMKAGAIAGNTNKIIGYHQIRYKGVLYYSHRLAVLAMTGVDAEEHVDHINGVRNDNRWSNLRLASHQENLSYRPKPKNNKSGQKGVFYLTRDKVWQAKFSNKSIGYFKDFDEACRAYKQFTQELLGEFYYDED